MSNSKRSRLPATDRYAAGRRAGRARAAAQPWRALGAVRAPLPSALARTSRLVAEAEIPDL